MLFEARLAHRARCFRQRDVVAPILHMLRECLSRHGCTSHAFCFLGAEIRVLVSGVTEDANLRAAIIEFQDLSRRWLIEHGLPSWQPGLFCRPILDADERQAIAIEVLSAPVRKALTPKLCQYPFVGSFEVSSEG